MRLGLLTFVTFGILMVGPGLAQSPLKLRGNGGSAPGSLGWLSMPSVQAELKLTPEQADRGKAIARELREHYETTKKALESLPRQDQLKKLVELSDNQYSEGMNALTAFLKPEQVDRFDQILFQRRGAAAMLEPDVRRDLKLTEFQREKISAIVREGRAEQMKILRTSPGDANAKEERVQANARDFKGRAVSLLGEDQKKHWEQLSGPEFEKKIGENITP